jgi:nucleotide-binding universal stress UspA family protein
MKLLVGVDGSEPANRAIAWCAKYASSLDAEIIAVHAVDIPLYSAPGVGYMPVAPLTDDDRDDLRGVVQTEWCAALNEASVPYRVIVEDGPPATILMEVARREQVDMVVTGRRGRGGFAELLLGSTSHQLSHHLDCALVIVP